MTSRALPDSVLAALAGPGTAYGELVHAVARRPGLYAFHGEEQVWSDLAVVPQFEGQPLYVGKAERSLHGRDVATHFAAGKTGSSTVRRSLAALLAEQLELIAVPRNLTKPDGSANFALDGTSETRLSQWMGTRLALATWVSSDVDSLDEIETMVVRQLRPPLNLDKVGEPRARLREARKRMADQARAWIPENEY